MSSSGKTLGAVEMVVGALLYEFGGEELASMGAAMFFSGAFTELSLMLAVNPATSGQDGIIRSSVANQQIVYGQIKTGGVLCFANAYGSNGSNSNAFLTVTIAHSLTRQNSTGTAGMPIQGIQGLYINDVYVPLSTQNSHGGWQAGRGLASGTGACSILSGTNGGQNEPWNPLSGNLWMSWSDGSQTTPDPILTTNFSNLPADFIGYGIAYSTWVLFMSADQGTFTGAFPSGINTPSTLGVVLAGQLLYDPRLDSNNGGSGTQRLNDTTTWVYSSNPALILADYLTRAKTDGGCGYNPGNYSGSTVIDSQINWAAVAAAANICDENVTVPTYGATWNGSAWSATETVSRYSCNMAVQTNRNCDANVADILKTMAGFITVAGGQIYIYAGAETVSSGPIDETFLAGSAGFSPQIQRSQMYNAVKITYGQEPQQDYNRAQGVPIINSTYETEDGGVRLWFSDTVPGCNNQFQCQILERIKSQQSRNKQVLHLTCNLKALNYQCGDVVDVSISELGLSSAPFRIMQYSLSSNYTAKMMLLQENAGTFALPATPDGVYQAYDTPNYQSLYNLVPSSPSAPTGVSAAAVSGGILLEWTPPAPNTYDYQIVYRATSATGPFTDVAHVVGDNWTDTNTASGTEYWYYLTSVNYWDQASTDSATVTATSNQGPISANLPNVIGTTASFTVTAAGWFEIALSDNVQYADYRCGFMATATVTNGSTPGQCEFRVSSDNTDAQAALTLVHGAKGTPITQARVRAADATHIALDVYVNWTTGTVDVQVAVAPITGAWNGAEAQAGLSASAGTVLQTLNMDPNSRGSNGGGIGHVGAGGNWHMLLDDGSFWHGGFKIGNAGAAGLDGVNDGNTYSRIQAAEITSNQWDPSKAGNSNAQTQYRSAVTGNQKNMVPDSDIKFNQVYWQFGLGGSTGINIVKNPNYGTDCGTGANNDNVFKYVGTGSPSGYNYVASSPFTVQTGQTVTLSAYCYSGSITAGSAMCALYLWTGSALGTIITSVTWNASQSGTRQSATATIPSGYNQAVLIFGTNNATVTSGDAVLWQHPQVEAGSVMTAYRSTDDQNGYSTYTGSGPVTSPTASFSYTSTTTSIDWSWTSMGWYNADYTETTVSNGSATTSSLSASTTYYFYPYDDLTASPAVSWVASGVGSTGYAHTSKSSSFVAQQNMASRIPLSSGGMSAATPSSGSGGGSGGGNACLHPETQISVRDSFVYDKEEAENMLKAGELIAGRHAVLTPDGWAVIRQHQQAIQHDWIELIFSSGERVTVTPSHVLQSAGGESVAARDLKLGTLLQGDDTLLSVVGLRAIYEPGMTTVLDVPGHWFYAKPGGVLHHNGTQKP